MIRGINSTFEVAINWTLYLKKPPSRSTGSTQLKSCRSDVLPSHPHPTRTTSERTNTWTNAATLTRCFEQLQRGCWRWDNKAAAPQSLFSSAAGGGRTAGNRWTCINYASNTYMPCYALLTAAVFSAKKMLQMLSGDFSETMSESCNWNVDRLWQLNTFITRGALLSEPAPLLSLNSPGADIADAEKR